MNEYMRMADRMYNLENQMHDLEKHIEELEKENNILRKALRLYVTWADECDVAWDNFPDMQEKWYETVEEKGLGWIDGLMFMATEEAREQLKG